MLFCIPGVLAPSEVLRMQEVFDGACKGDGRATAGYRARQVKMNLQVVVDDKTRTIHEEIREALLNNSVFRSVAIPRHVRLPIMSEYGPGMEYGYHTDEAIMGQSQPMRTDLSVTIFLSDPSSYVGGDLVIRTAMGETGVRLDAGDAVVYPTIYRHRVDRVQTGLRRVAVTWVQSWIRSVEQRQILHDLDNCRLLANARESQAEDTQLLYATYGNLLRMWSDG